MKLFIPYITPRYWGEELRYALRSWEKYFIDDVDVLIVGDRPEWITNIDHVPYERIKTDNHPLALEACNKMLLALNKVEGDFIYSYDDIILTDYLTFDGLKIPVALQDMETKKRVYSSKWRLMLWRTYDVLKKNGFDKVYNYETHIPRVFNKDKMLHIFKKYHPAENRLMFNTLYGNEFNKDPVILNKSDNIKAGFYGRSDDYSFQSNSENQIKSFIFKKKFTNFNDQGLSNGLKRVIINHFTDKSKYEVAL